MAVEELDDDTFAARIAESERAVVDFYAGWCGPCVLFKPKFRRLSGEYPHVRFFLCDGERAPASRKTVTFDDLPYFGFYRNGELVGGLSTTKEAGFTEALEKHFGPAG